MGALYPQWQKIIRIDVTNPPTATGYQVKVEIPWQLGMKDDFSDIRFSDNFRTLPYWIESSTSRSTATVWVKLTEINNAANEFYYYFDNGTASSESSGDNVFELFDDFLGSSVDTGRWTTRTGTISVSNSEVTVTNTATATPQGLKSAATYGSGYVCRYRAKLTKGSGDTYAEIAFDSWTYAIDIYNEGTTFNLQNYNGSDSTIYSLGSSNVNYNTFECVKESASKTRARVNDGSWIDGTAYIPSASLPLTVRPYTLNGSYNYVVVDWVLVRLYQATEPVCTPAAYGINTAFYQMVMRAKHVFEAATYPYTLAVSFVTDHMHLTWTEP
jgi:hypothetical protein